MIFLTYSAEIWINNLELIVLNLKNAKNVIFRRHSKNVFQKLKILEREEFKEKGD